MRRLVFGLLVAGVVGCGGGSKPLRPLSEEEKAAIKAHDQRTEEEEHSGSGKHTRKK
jgi:hypothetical protein